MHLCPSHMGLLTGTSIYSGSQIPTVGEGGAREIHAERGGLWCARLCNAYPASGSRLASNAGLIPSFCSRSTSNGAIPRENRRMDGGLQHYNHSEHAVFDLKCHVIWCTKHRCKILRGRVAERAARSHSTLRQVLRRDVVIVRWCLSIKSKCCYQHRPLGTSQTSALCKRSILATTAERIFGDNGESSVGAGILSARRWARSMRQQQKSISRPIVR